MKRLFETFQPERELERRQNALAEWIEKLESKVHRRLEVSGEKLDQVQHLLESLSPDAVLRRGFSMTLDEAGNPIVDAASAKSGQKIVSHLAKGEVHSTVD